MSCPTSTLDNSTAGYLQMKDEQDNFDLLIMSFSMVRMCDF